MQESWNLVRRRCVNCGSEVAVILVLVLTLPEGWGIDGVWMSLPVAQIVIAVLALVLLYALYRRFRKYPDRPEYVRTPRV